MSWFAAIRTCVVLLALAGAGTAFGQSKVGTTGAAFLEIGVGARAVALGEAGAATTDDVTAMYWNPAGLARMGASEVAFHYTEWFAGTSLQYAAGTIALGGGQLGAHVYVFDGGEMDVTTLEFEDGTGETFRVQDAVFGLSYGRYLTDAFALGGTLKLVRTGIWRMSASALALDLGIQYATPFRGVRLGFALSNFGGELELEGDNTIRRIDLDPLTAGDNDALLAHLGVRSWDLPLVFRLGLAYDAVQTPRARLTLTTDALYPNNNEQHLNVGLEAAYRDLFFVRGGYSNLFLDDAYGQGHLRVGFGVQVAGMVRADYAFARRGDLGDVSLVGAAIQF